MNASHRLVRLAGMAVLLSVGATAAPAQPDSAGRLQGVVGKVGTAERLPEAEVFLDGRAVARTKEDGTFDLAGLPSGQHRLVVRTLGYRPAVFLVTLAAGQVTALQIGLEERVTTLEGVVVEGVRVRPGPFAHIEARERRGLGDFIWREEFDRRGMQQVSQALQLTGKVDISVIASDATRGRTLTIITMGHGITKCIPVLYLDGAPFQLAGQQIDDMFDLYFIEAIEVYDQFEVPPDLGGPGQGCGVIAFWTRIE